MTHMIVTGSMLRLCSICKAEHTAFHIEVLPGAEIYACEDCLQSAERYFIWICMACRKVYAHSKELVIGRIHDSDLKEAYLQCMDERFIQGISRCIACDSRAAMASLEEMSHGSPPLT